MVKFIKIALAIGNFFEVFIKEGSAFAAGGVFPFGLFGEELVGIFFPVALETGGFGGGGGGGAVLMIT